MKKIFTFLFCLMALGLTAQADEALVNQCIDAALNNANDQVTLASPSIDVNHDGVINITDVTLLINQDLAEKQAVKRAPKNKKGELVPMQKITDYNLKKVTPEKRDAAE